MAKAEAMERLFEAEENRSHVKLQFIPVKQTLLSGTWWRNAIKAHDPLVYANSL